MRNAITYKYDRHGFVGLFSFDKCVYYSSHYTKLNKQLPINSAVQQIAER